MKKNIYKFRYLTIGLILCLLVAQGCSSKKECSTCNGTGQMNHSTCNGTGLLMGMKDFSCGGTGKIKCQMCSGTGEVAK